MKKKATSDRELLGQQASQKFSEAKRQKNPQAKKRLREEGGELLTQSLRKSTN